MSTVKRLKEFLDQFHDDDDPIAWAIWCDEDVQNKFSEMKEYGYFDECVDIPDELPEEAIRDILFGVDNNWNAEYGINWDLIDSEIDWYVSEHYKRKE